MPVVGLSVAIDTERIRANTKRIARDTGVPIIAVVKANAYGLGARRVVEAIHDLVDGFYCFSFEEALDARAFDRGKRTLVLISGAHGPDEYIEHNFRPTVWDIHAAAQMRTARPILAVDTGMQRFAAKLDSVDPIIEAGGIEEAFTHATRVEQVEVFRDRLAHRSLKLHAAATALLDQPKTFLDFVRPGLALYENALRASVPLCEARDSTGPVGYRGITSSTGRHGVILAGYSHGLKPGSCFINGSPRLIFECGMQSSFVELGKEDRTGDEVIVLGDEIPLASVANAWETSRQEVLLRLLTQNPQR